MLMKIAEGQRSFVPKFNGNSDLPESEQVVATYKIPDINLKRKLKSKPKHRFNYDAEGRYIGSEAEFPDDKQTVIAGMLISLKNANYEDSKGIHKMLNTQELFQGPTEYDPLIDELYDEFKKELDRTVDEKN